MPKTILAEHLRPDSIVLDLKATDKWALIRELLDLLDRQGLVGDFEKVHEDLIARENKMSTGLEEGLAIPHAKSSGTRALAVALGVKSEGIDFDSLDGKPAQIIFLVVSRLDTTGPHIQCLAEIASLCKRRETRDAFIAAKTPQQVLDIVARAPS